MEVAVELRPGVLVEKAETWAAGFLEDRLAGESDFLYHQGDQQTGFARANVRVQSASIQGIARQTGDADSTGADH
jgi:hypothetical protein